MLFRHQDRRPTPCETGPMGPILAVFIALSHGIGLRPASVGPLEARIDQDGARTDAEGGPLGRSMTVRRPKRDRTPCETDPSIALEHGKRRVSRDPAERGPGGGGWGRFALRQFDGPREGPGGPGKGS